LFVPGDKSKELNSPSLPEFSKPFKLAFALKPFTTSASIIDLNLLNLINE
jgi:hypothetical protein